MPRLHFWRRPLPPPRGVDPELWEIARAQGEKGSHEILLAARQIRRLLRAQRWPEADPAFRERLRDRLMAEARSRQRRARRRLLWGPLSATAGIAVVAGATLVIASVVARPLQGPAVTAKAAVAGQHQVSVTKAITISFNQPMDESAVLHGLSIKPAVSYRARWVGPQKLVIEPAHGLAPNVGYVVTINKPSAESESGAKAQSSIVIPFGTGSAPATPLGQIPRVESVTTTATVEGATALDYTADGALLIEGSPTAPELPAPQPSPSPSPSPSSSPVPTPTLGIPNVAASSPSPPRSTTLGPVAGRFGGLYRVGTTVIELAPQAMGATPSPDGQNVAYWAPGPDSTLELQVVAAKGGSPEQLASTAEPDPGLSWVGNGALLFPAAGQLRQVTLAGAVSFVYPEVALDPSGAFSLSPSGQAVVASPDGVPTLYSLTQGTSTTLAGLVGNPAWSPSGSDLVYLSSSSGVESIEWTADLGLHSRALLQAPAGTDLSDLTFDPSDTYVSYLATPALGASQLDALDLQSGRSGELGTLLGVSSPVWSPEGDQLSLLVQSPLAQVQDLDTLLLSGTPAPSTEARSAAQVALAAASTLAALQVQAEPQALAAINPLLSPGTQLSPGVLLPGRFDRFYAISSTPTAPTSSEYSVEVDLVSDATQSSAPAYLTELVFVQTSGATPLITDVVPGVLTRVPTGPLVLSVSTTSLSDGTTVLSIEFDSDIDPLTVGPRSIVVTAGGETVRGALYDYSPLTRTATVTIAQLPPGQVTVTVEAPLADVDHTAIEVPFQVTLQPVGNASPTPG